MHWLKYMYIYVSASVESLDFFAFIYYDYNKRGGVVTVVKVGLRNTKRVVALE